MEFDSEECILFGNNNLQETDRACILLFSYQDFADINIHQICNILMESRKFSVRYLARIMAGNVNSSMGSLLTFIGGELNLAINQINEVSPKVIKGHYICWFWTRRGVENISLHELVQVRSSAFQYLHIPGFDGDEINDLLNWICIS